MANYYATCRSNYFKVIDKTKFEEFVSSFSSSLLIQEDEEDENLICLLVEDPDGAGWPTYKYNDETDTYEDVDFFTLIASHLEKDSVAVFQEVGHEKLRYLVGYSVAVFPNGKIITVNINDIYKKIRRAGCEATPCEY